MVGEANSQGQVAATPVADVLVQEAINCLEWAIDCLEGGDKEELSQIVETLRLLYFEEGSDSIKGAGKMGEGMSEDRPAP